MSTKSSETVVYYFSNKELSIQELKLYYKQLPSVIQVVYNNQMDIIDVHSSIKHKGYATALLVYASKEAIKKGISIITLDDCSDNWNKPHNIYIKIGFEYIDSSSGPEMKGNAECISNYPSKTKLEFKIFKHVI